MAVIDNKTNDYPPMLLKIIDVYENHWIIRRSMLDLLFYYQIVFR
jgi:hypothetical protein